MEEQSHNQQERQSLSQDEGTREIFSPFYTELDRFVTHIVSLKNTAPLVVNSIGAEIARLDGQIGELVKEHAIEKRVLNENEEVYVLKGVEANKVVPLLVRYKHLRIARAFIPKSFIVTLIGQYDAFLGRVLRWAFHYRPGILHRVENTSLTYPELAQFSDIEEARDYIVESVSERVLRKSHMDQIHWIKKHLNVHLREMTDIWPKFVEVTERRNLFVHTDGYISDQYLRVCERYGVTLPEDVQKDKPLNVSQEYFQEAVNTIYEVGVIVGQLVWRHILRDDIDLADQSLIDITYSLLVEENYELAIRLLTFATDKLKKHSSEEVYLIHLINKAQAYKWKGDGFTCESIISQVDWSAKSLKFKLAVSVLREEFEEASAIMRQIGPAGEMPRIAYHEWPIFKQFRLSDEFRRAYQEIFGEEYQDYVLENGDEQSIR